MDALRRSVRRNREPAASKQPSAQKRIEGQKEMLFSIAGKKAARKKAGSQLRQPAGVKLPADDLSRALSGAASHFQVRPDARAGRSPAWFGR